MATTAHYTAIKQRTWETQGEPGVEGSDVVSRAPMVLLNYVVGETCPESIGDRSAKCASSLHLATTQLQSGWRGPQSCTGFPCFKLQWILSFTQLPYRVSVTLNPIIDFFKCHFIQRGTVAFWKAQMWLQCSSSVLPVALSPAVKQRCYVYLLPLMCCSSLFPSSPSLRADLRIHPSPTAGSVTAASSASTVQGKPSLRRIKGRIHRSKSLDSIDLLDANVSKVSQSQRCINELQ